MFVKVLDVRCCGYALCHDACPEVFELDDQGFAFVAEAEVPAGLQQRARDGAEACPESAILVADHPFDGSEE